MTCKIVPLKTSAYQSSPAQLLFCGILWRCERTGCHNRLESATSNESPYRLYCSKLARELKIVLQRNAWEDIGA